MKRITIIAADGTVEDELSPSEQFLRTRLSEIVGGPPMLMAGFSEFKLPFNEPRETVRCVAYHAKGQKPINKVATMLWVQARVRSGEMKTLGDDLPGVVCGTVAVVWEE